MNEQTFQENHLRMLYRLLGHKGYTSRVGSLDFSRTLVNAKTGRESFLYEEEYVQGEDQVIEYAKRYNMQRNIFIGRAFRDARGTCLGTNCITLDLDPIREKNTAATLEQHKLAMQAGRRILASYPFGYLASSGNGALLVYRLPRPITGDMELKEHYEKEKILIKELQEIAGEGIRIDATSYDQAIIKSIGTYSTKGEMSLRRCSQWITYPVLPYKHSSKLLQRFNDIKPTKQVAENGINIKAIMSTFNGDRSQADFHLLSYLKRAGVDAASALVALQTNPLGRQTDEKDQTRLIRKIYGADAGALRSASDQRTNDYFGKLFTPKTNSEGDISTGFSVLDMALGPLPKGELTTFSARSGFGKTTFGCTLAEHWRKQGKKVLFFSTEMHSHYIMHKLLSLACEIPLAQTIQRNFTQEQIVRIRAYEQELLQSPITIVDTFQPTLQQVQAEILKCKPDILIFDHITQSGTHWEHVAQFTRGLKDVTTQENIVTVLLSMLNEPPRKQDGSVSTSVRGDVRGSQEIIFLSAIFCLLSNPYEIKGRYQPVDVLIAKNRYGISNQTVPLTCDKEISRFIERNSSHEPDEV